MQSNKYSLGLAWFWAMFAIAMLMTATLAAGQAEKVLHTFGSNSKGGVGPEDGLTFDSIGNLYGAANSGGTDDGGIVYELSPKAGGGWMEKVLYSFLKNGLDGASPAAGVVFDSAGNLYGLTSNGGPDGVGTAYELSPPVPPATQWTEKVLTASSTTAPTDRTRKTLW